MKSREEMLKCVLPKDLIWDEGYKDEYKLVNCPVKEVFAAFDAIWHILTLQELDELLKQEYEKGFNAAKGA